MTYKKKKRQQLVKILQISDIQVWGDKNHDPTCTVLSMELNARQPFLRLGS